jgi:hypothetical protein
MKALTVKQPWAWAIIFGGKDIENRSWRTRYRGPLLIHAGAAYRPEASMPRRVRAPAKDRLDFSAIIGAVELTGVVEKSKSPWFRGKYGFVLAKPLPLKPPIPCKGRLGLWTPTAAQLRRVAARLSKRSAIPSGLGRRKVARHV